MLFECTEQTGRFTVTSQRTGRKYCVEAVGNPHIVWGDVNPATKKITGNYGNKYRGSIDEKDSVITSANGFDEIHWTGVGNSPMKFIEKLDAKYPTI